MNSPGSRNRSKLSSPSSPNTTAGRPWGQFPRLALSQNTNFALGILHYASDTPYSRRQSLLSKSLGAFGTDSTYACAIAITRQILAREIARLS